jgi:hypothetical protein
MAKPPKDKPWAKYRHEVSGQGRLRWKLLEPGWAGSLDPDEVSYIQEKLKADPMLAYWWGYRPGQRSRPVSAIEKVAMYGSPEVRSENVKLTRVRQPLAAA